MIRVYLDWNVFSNLKNNNNKEPFISLNNNLFKNKDKILIPYSSAHLTDLIKSYQHSFGAKRKTLSDLQFLEKLTDHLCIIYDYKTKDTYPDKYNIKEYFKQLFESNKLNWKSFEDLLSNFRGYGVDDKINEYLNLMSNTKIDLDLSLLNDFVSAPIDKQDSKQPISYLELLESSFNLINDYTKNPSTYRNLRNKSLNILKLNKDYSESEKPIEDISKKLKDSEFKQTFKEFVDQNIKVSFPKEDPSRFDIFTYHYILLDFFGYYRDRSFPNLVQDSFHAYYGAHCDYYITDDDNSYKKTKALYSYFKIETVVCKSHEFNHLFYNRNTLNNRENISLLEIINQELKSAFVITNKYDDQFNAVDLYKVNYYLQNYFNRIQITHLPNGSHVLYLFKKFDNYSTFYFFREVEITVNNIVNEFGIDQNLRMQYNPSIENKEMKENKWLGRRWLMKNCSIVLSYNDAPFGLTLEIDFSNGEHV